MHILLLIVYGALAAYGIWKIPFLRNSGIRLRWLWLLFALHVLMGWAHNWIAWRYFPEHGDIWNYFTLSFLYRHRLLSEFHLFLSDNSTWTYITHNGIVFIQMLLDLLSADDMNINTLLFAFPVFVGNVALFRVFRRRFADDTLAATTVFWLPSVLFWTSCIYREGMLYMLLGFLFYNLDRLPGWRRMLSAVLLFVLVAYFRLAVAIMLVPALLVWYWIDLPRSRRPKRRTLLAIFGILIALACCIPVVREYGLQVVTGEQSDFQKLEGHSRLALPAFDGTFSSIWRAFPFALVNGFFQPLPGSGGQTVYLLFSIELIFIWLVVFFAFFGFFASLRRRRGVDGSGGRHPPISDSNCGEFAAIRWTNKAISFSAACLVFALAGMLTIGFIVPFAGTIVRYRSIYLPFLLAPCLHTLRRLPIVARLNHWLNNKLRFLI
jgi:hypothetical protein